jgi:hypothetical protein
MALSLQVGTVDCIGLNCLWLLCYGWRVVLYCIVLSVIAMLRREDGIA